MNELQIQRKLKDAAIDLGGKAWKTSTRFLPGVPDIGVQIPDETFILLEVKWMARVPRTKLLTLEVSPPQWKFIMDFNDAGGYAGCVLVAALDRGAYAVYPRRYAPKYQEQLMLDSAFVIFKRLRDPWPIKSIVQTILNS